MTQNSSNQDYSNNSDGWTLGGGTTVRKLTISGGDVSFSASGSNIFTFPASADTLVGRASTDTLTNKTIDGNNNTITNLGTSSLAESAVTADKLAASAITLGYVPITNLQGGITGTEIDLTGLSITVVVPTGGRDVRITVSLWPSTSSVGDVLRTFIKEGSNYLGFHNIYFGTTAGLNQYFSVVVQAPSAGVHTYKVSVNRIVGSGTVSSNAGVASTGYTPAFILVEAI